MAVVCSGVEHAATAMSQRWKRSHSWLMHWSRSAAEGERQSRCIHVQRPRVCRSRSFSFFTTSLFEHIWSCCVIRTLISSFRRSIHVAKGARLRIRSDKEWGVAKGSVEKGRYCYYRVFWWVNWPNGNSSAMHDLPLPETFGGKNSSNCCVFFQYYIVVHIFSSTLISPSQMWFYKLDAVEF